MTFPSNSTCHSKTNQRMAISSLLDGEGPNPISSNGGSEGPLENGNTSMVHHPALSDGNVVRAQTPSKALFIDKKSYMLRMKSRLDSIIQQDRARALKEILKAHEHDLEKERHALDSYISELRTDLHDRALFHILQADSLLTEEDKKKIKRLEANQKRRNQRRAQRAAFLAKHPEQNLKAIAAKEKEQKLKERKEEKSSKDKEVASRDKSKTADKDRHAGTGSITRKRKKSVKEEDVVDIDGNIGSSTKPPKVKIAKIESSADTSTASSASTVTQLAGSQAAVRKPPSQKEIRAVARLYQSTYDAIWKDLARKDSAKVNKILLNAQNVKQSNGRKTASLVAKEARRWQYRTNKNVKDLQSRARRGMREMLGFWKKNEKEERDLRKKAEKEALDQVKKEEEQREAKRQERKLNFLITQTELYSHFVGKKIDGQADGEDSTEAPLINADEPLDFDNADDAQIKYRAMLNAQNAVQSAQDKARAFNESPDEDGEMNFQNPTSLGDMQLSQPKMLSCQLKEYQLKGLNWLANLYEQGINGILADEMGLGKTVQSISVMAYLAETHNIWGPYLVVAPASTLHNWQQEIAKFVPTFKVLPYWGNGKDRKVLRKFWDRKQVKYTKDSPFHVLVTSYQLVVADSQYFSRIKWQYMILDEAQAIKSSSSSRWKSLLAFQCRNRLLLTGTPIQNSMQELWALLHFIMPSLFDSHEEFSEWFSKDIESHAQTNSKLNEEQLKRLHMILRPFMLRRVKKHVQKELGDKIEIDVYCDLTSRQRTLYRMLRAQISVLDLIERAQSDEGAQSLMNLVMQFRKVCNHPDLFERADVSSAFNFSTFGETPAGSLLREKEGQILDVDYTAENLISLPIPKLIYRHGGVLSQPCEESDELMRRKLALNTFSPFAGGNTTLASLCGSSLSDWAMLNRMGIFERSLFLMETGPATAKGSLVLSPLSEKLVERAKTSAVMQDLLSVGERIAENQYYHVTERAFDEPVLCPPIKITGSDKGIIEDQKSLLDENWPAKNVMFPLTLNQEWSLLQQGVKPGDFPLSNLYPAAKNVRAGYTSIRMPSMAKFVTDSGKLAKLDQLLTELKANDHRVLVYFQMTKMMDLMEEYLTYRQYRYVRLDGSSKLSERRDLVNDWQTKPELFVFLLSTRAGGLGINLTAADTVIFYDSDWNPTIDSQAMDRAHRLGQTKQVTVYRLLARGTIEERMRDRAKQKMHVQNVVMEGGSSADFQKPGREMALWLLDDDSQVDAALKASNAAGKESTTGSNGKKRKRKTEKEASANGFSLEDMYHEDEGNFEESRPGTGTSTPTPNVFNSHKKMTTEQRLRAVGGDI